MSDETGSLSLFQAFTTMLDSMARLFELRGVKAEGRAKTDLARNKEYWDGFAAAYQDAAKECRAAATKLRTP